MKNVLQNPETNEGAQSAPPTTPSLTDVERESRTGARGGAANYGAQSAPPTTPTSDAPKAPAPFVPSLGRIVIYGKAAVLGSAVEFHHDVAQITAVNPDGTVELTVSPAKGNARDVNKSTNAHYFVERVDYSAEPKAGHYWTPPYVAQPKARAGGPSGVDPETGKTLTVHTG